METKGLITGNFGFGMTMVMVLSVLGLLIIMILGQAPFVMVISWGAVTIYVFYLGVFAGTKYHLNADGIYTDSFISRYSKNFSWNELINIEETVLAYTNRGRGNCGVYYVIATSEDVERERGLLERMKCEEIICVPVTKKTKECMAYYAQRYHLNIIKQSTIGSKM